jgi:hypothetical protein
MISFWAGGFFFFVPYRVRAKPAEFYYTLYSQRLGSLVALHHFLNQITFLAVCMFKLPALLNIKTSGCWW